MNNNNSPWLHQLKITRPIDKLNSDTTTQVTVVGAGVAGVMTAYFILKNTDKQVLLVEASRVAHGATGHNAGQLVVKFERDFASMVKEYGLEMSADAEKSVRSAWLLLEQAYEEANLSTPMSSFMGYNGYATVEKVVEEMRNDVLRLEAGLQTFPIYIAENAPGVENIPSEYKGLYSLVPHQDIQALLETKDKQYVAVIAEKKGCVNGALLVEEIVGYLLTKYQGRFVLAEETPVAEVILEKDKAVIRAGEYSITSDRVVMCTNGFEKFKLTNNAGGDINIAFHQMVHGTVGYMAAYLEELKHPPIALSYIDKTILDKHIPLNTMGVNTYYYMTRRPYEIEKNEHHNLICLGGPEQKLNHVKEYIPDADFLDSASVDMDKFLHKTYEHAPKEPIDFKFKWHGLMGYTPSGLRVVGEEPRNKVLMYNLGCNGVGILTSIYGASRIADIIAGKELAPSVFDPKCEYIESV